MATATSPNLVCHLICMNVYVWQMKSLSLIINFKNTECILEQHLTLVFLCVGFHSVHFCCCLLLPWILNFERKCFVNISLLFYKEEMKSRPISSQAQTHAYTYTTNNALFVNLVFFTSHCQMMCKAFYCLHGSQPSFITSKS